MNLLTPELQKALLDSVASLAGLVVTAVGIIGGYVLWRLKTYVQNQIGSQQFEWISSYADTTVSSLMQNPIYKQLKNEIKKEKAVELITSYCQAHGLSYSTAEIDALVESAVSKFKIWQPTPQVNASAK